MKKSPVSGKAGAARVYQLTLADLRQAEKHGKRLDLTSKARAIYDAPPVTTTGLDLKRLFEAHVKEAFVPRARAKAMHVVVQFPKDLVDGEDAEYMLHHARKFCERVFGPDAIFADRVDRDEKGRHVVDLFVAPKYIKKTKHQEKLAVTVSIHLKALAKKYNRNTKPRGTGQAVQDALVDYFRDEMGLNGVERGSPKLIAGPDWKSAEKLREEELDTKIVQAEGREAAAFQQEREAAALREQATVAFAEAERIRLELEVSQSEADLLNKRAAEEAKLAEQARLDAEAELTEAQAKLTEAEAAKEESTRAAQRAEEDRLTVASERAAMKREKEEQIAALARQWEKLPMLDVQQRPTKTPRAVVLRRSMTRSAAPQHNMLKPPQARRQRAKVTTMLRSGVRRRWLRKLSSRLIDAPWMRKRSSTESSLPCLLALPTTRLGSIFA